MSSLKYWVWLSSCDGVGSATAGALIKHFQTPENVFNADNSELREIVGVKLSDISALNNKNLAKADNILAVCHEKGFSIVTIQDAAYPDRLRNIFNPPVLIYLNGKLPEVDEEATIAVVGTRNCTPYGISKAGELGCELGKLGFIVVSGLAKGVDAAAMRGAMRGGGKVIGVIGSGLDIIYPYENRELFEDTVNNGAIISEYPPGTPPVPGHFPSRNRIVSGLSVGIAVIEAPKKSGALITAAAALEQGRDVFAMPGNVDAKTCEGSNNLLREGAIPLLSVDDIVNEYAGLFPDRVLPDGQTSTLKSGSGISLTKSSPVHDTDKAFVVDPEQPDTKKVIDNITSTEYIDLNNTLQGLTGDEETIARVLGVLTLNTDEIIASSGLPAQRVLTSLTMLEIKGIVLRTSGQHFSLNVE